MNKLQSAEYQAETNSFSRFWVAMVTILSLLLSSLLVFKLKGYPFEENLGLTSIIFILTWVPLYFAGLVWHSDRAYKKARQEG